MNRGLENSTLIYRRDLNDTLSIVRVRPDSGLVPEFEPGQFTMLGLLQPVLVAGGGTVFGADLEPPRSDRPKTLKRAYSIASPTTIREWYEFLVVLVEQGQLTPKLWTYEEGDRLWMDTRVKGKFTLKDTPPGKHLIMVATGTGIAPYVSMIKTYRGQGCWNLLTLIHGVRRVSDLAYREEIEGIREMDPTIRYIPTVTREPEDSPWEGLRGRVQGVFEGDRYQTLTGAPLDPGRCSVFLCGNPAMIRELRALLEQRGFRIHTAREPGNIHIEQYW